MSPRDLSLTRLLKRSVYLWPIAFLLAAFIFVPPVPPHWLWDNFSYLDAAKSRQPFVPLGSGRTAFCTLGMAVDYTARKVFGTGPFALFHLWMAAGIILQAGALATLAGGLRRRLGVAGTHVALGLVVCHTWTFVLFLGVWPENWSLAILLLSFAVLLSRSMDFWKRFWISAVLALSSFLLKEVYISFLPAWLFMVWIVAGERGLDRKTALEAVGWGLLATGGVFLCLYIVLPWVIPGLGEAREELRRGFFGAAAPSPGAMAANAGELLETLRRSPGMFWLTVAGIAWLIWQAVRGGLRNRKLLAGYIFTALLLGGPLLAVLWLGQQHLIFRYSQMLVPGLAFAAALTVAQVEPLWSRFGPRATLIVTALAILVCYFGAQRGPLRFHVRLAQEDHQRYTAMQLLREEPLAILAGDDARAAEYMKRHGGKRGERADWEILFPGWDVTDRGEFPAEWIASQRETWRRFAVAPSALGVHYDASAAHREEVFARLREHTGLTFSEHPAGWWVEE